MACAIYRNTGAGEIVARLALSVVLAASLLAASTGGAVGAAEVVPHRGIYEMSLLAADQSSGIIGASGEMYFEWGEACDGWTVNQHVRLHLSQSDSQTASMGLIFSGWESRDGKRLRFVLRHTADDRVSEEIEGEAELFGASGGVARFTSPAGLELTLPRGTVFPTMYSREQMARAEAGRNTYSATVFDGTTTDGAYEVTSFIGDAIMRPAPGTKGENAKQEKYWPIRMAYFRRGLDVLEPDFEIGEVVNAGSISYQFDLDYGTFSVRAVLKEYEALPVPDCD